MTISAADKVKQNKKSYSLRLIYKIKVWIYNSYSILTMTESRRMGRSGHAI
jgi:hypothetical protein